MSLGALAPWRPSQSMILRSGSRDPQTHQGKSWPGMHRVWTRVDSGVTAEKLMRYHVVSCKISILAFPRAKFLSRVDLDLPLRFFVLRPLGCFDDTTQTILVSFRAGVLCQDLGIQDLAPVSHKCTRVWLGVDSGVPVRKQTRHYASTLR